MKYMNICRKIRFFTGALRLAAGRQYSSQAARRLRTRPYKAALEPLQGPEHRLLGRVVLDTTEDGGFCKIQKMNVAVLKN